MATIRQTSQTAIKSPIATIVPPSARLVRSRGLGIEDFADVLGSFTATLFDIGTSEALFDTD